MTTLREAAQMHIEDLKKCIPTLNEYGLLATAAEFQKAIDELSAALAQPEQGPVAWMGIDIEGNPNKFRLNQFGNGIPLYTAPPQREWQGLTDDDFIGLTTPQIFAMKFAEAKLREKNQ